jgi:putative NIF3 family GTP cyclohydrolase 1 type 2
VTGGAGDGLKLAADEGVDTFITGEGPHWTYALAEELGINVLYGGHYATETFGVKALAADLSKKFKARKSSGHGLQRGTLYHSNLDRWPSTVRPSRRTEK